MKSHFLSRKTKGFTLIELIIVIGILAVLSSIAYPTYMSISENAKRAAAEKVCVDIATGVERYAQDNNGALPYDSGMAQPDSADQIVLESAGGKDARLIEVLTNREMDDDNRLNTTRDTYLRSDEKQDGAKRDGLYVDEASNEVSLYDIWGEPYHIILCEEQEGCADPFTRKRFRGKHCFVYSTGPDREGVAEAAPDADSAAARDGKGKKGKKGKKQGKKESKKEQQAAAAAALEAMQEVIEDNVYSWKKKS